MNVNVGPKFESLLYDQKRFLILCGGAGSGKSLFAGRKLFYRCMIEGGHRFFIFRKIAATLNESVIKVMRDILIENNAQYDENKTAKIISFNGNELHFCGMDDPEKLKSVEKMTGSWMEEATEFQLDDMMQLNLRLRGKLKNYKQNILSFNPVESAAPWLKEMFFDSIHPDATVHVSTAWDNPFIDHEYLDQLDSIKDDTYRKIYRLGEWALAEGIIYSNWKVSPDQPGKVEHEIYGLDFGYNNPSALVHVRICEGVAWVQEKIYQKQLTNAQLIERLKSLNIPRNIPIYADSAEPNRIEEIRQAGFYCQPAEKDVKLGIDTVNTYQLIIHPDSVNLIKEIKAYKWEAEKKGINKDRPVKFMDHILDACRYAIYSNHCRTVRVPRVRMVS